MPRKTVSRKQKAVDESVNASRKTVSRKRKASDEIVDVKAEVFESLDNIKSNSASIADTDAKTELSVKKTKKTRTSASATKKSASTTRTKGSSDKVKSAGRSKKTSKISKAHKVEDNTSGIEEATEEKQSEKIAYESNEMKCIVNSLVPFGHKFVGAHVSGAGGLENAVHEAFTIGARAFGLFLRNQRQWLAKPLTDETVVNFSEAMKKYGYSHDMVLPHASYLLNCGSSDDGNLKKSRDLLIDELKRCERLGLKLYNIHPGSTNGVLSVDECLDRIGDSINMALTETRGVTVVIENMSCQGNTVGGKFEELRGIIDRINDKSRIGVCLDTCHAFAAGFDVKSRDGYEQMMSQFDSIVGLKYLKAMHINDSKGEVGCHLDRHEDIGRGKIGLDAFKYIMNDSRLNNIPLVVETPADDYAKEISKLYSLVHK